MRCNYSKPNFFIVPAVFLIFDMVRAFANGDTNGGRVYFVGAIICIALASDRRAQNRKRDE